ncbi:MAG TPA: hypothetical protein VGQ89_15000 [Candidatus Limnocylindrales bacterium]|jgi:hypothetical protein|nr:hypothetical protein [Candidatus Limnocylindrales bacterium]
MNAGEPRSGAAEERGCLVALAFGAVILLALGATLLATSRPSFTGLVFGWFAVVGASLAMLTCGLTWTVDRIAARVRVVGRDPLVAAGALIVTAVGAWSLWYGMGSPSQGTLTEGVPALVDPVVAALFGLTARTRTERVAAVAFAVVAGVTVVAVAQLVAAVGPTY